jgi:hypothetical protein
MKIVSHNNFSYKSHPPLFSVVIPYNDAFSHTFSTGVSMCVYMIPTLINNPHARILVPEKGTFHRLLESVGVRKQQIIRIEKDRDKRKGKNSIFYSENATLILRRPPFNIVQAHWPAHALNDMRNKTVDWLLKHKYINSTWPQNKVVYLWRAGKRSVRDEEYFGDCIYIEHTHIYILSFIHQYINTNNVLYYYIIYNNYK